VSSSENVFPGDQIATTEGLVAVDEDGLMRSKINKVKFIKFEEIILIYTYNDSNRRYLRIPEMFHDDLFHNKNHEKLETMF
jgi:hypothetical protein